MKKTSFIDNWIYNGRTITLPHDAMIHEKRDPKAACGSAGAFFPGGKYVYEKKFQRPSGENAAHVLLQFEGVYKDAKVYVNDRLAGGAAYGYIPFFVKLDDFLQDGENTVRVECAVEQPDSRWYSGAGIYRPVWLWTGPADSIEPESVRISTVSYDPAVIRVRAPKNVAVSIIFAEGAAEAYRKKTASIDDEESSNSAGKRNASGSSSGVIASGSGTDFELTIPDAKLWSDETPNLYTARVTNGADEEEIRFGIRRIEWSNKGLFINGKETLLRGGCLHHDNGILGAATYDESEYRRVKMLKDAGFNAIRSAHNPCSRAMLEACDELGVYMMDETWDMWYYHKTKHDYATEWRDHYLGDIDAMIAKDYNHPSVIMYSLGNEVSEPAKAEGVEKLHEMVQHVHEADPIRPASGGFNLMIISQAAKGKGIFDENDGGRKDDGSGKKMQGMNSTMFNLITSMIGPGMNKSTNGKKADAATTPALDALDIAGYNYASGRYPLEGKAHPNRVIFGSETFPQTISQNWEMVKKYPYLIGDFMWTAWDYLGEAGIGAWAYTEDGKGFDKPYPWLLGDAGALDILGNPNGELFWAEAVWGKRTSLAVQPINHDRKPVKGAWRGTNAIPSWSWQGCEGKKAIVEVYTDGAKVKLALNGKKVGKARVKNHRAVLKVAYEPGRLEAIAYDANDQEVGRAELSTASGAKLAVRPEKAEVRSGEICYVPVLIADEAGNVESNADRKVKVSVENGELLAFGSANPRTEEQFDAGEYTTYYGRALAVVRAGSSGTVKVKASDDREEASTEITVR